MPLFDLKGILWPSPPPPLDHGVYYHLPPFNLPNNKISHSFIHSFILGRASTYCGGGTVTPSRVELGHRLNDEGHHQYKKNRKCVEYVNLILRYGL